MKHTYLKNTQLTINFKYLKYVKILKYYILINNLYLLKNSYKDHDEQNVNIYIYISIRERVIVTLLENCFTILAYVH